MASPSPISTANPPRPSLDSRSSSRRVSLDSPALGSPRPTIRDLRTRTALRDYYGIKSPPLDSSAARADEAFSEIDRDGFNADDYATNLLENEGLGRVLRVENELVSGKPLDGRHGPCLITLADMWAQRLEDSMGRGKPLCTTTTQS